MKGLTPHICRRSGRIFSADFLADFVKTTCEGACLTSVALAATIGNSAKAHKTFPPQICITFSFSFTLTLAHCNAVMHKTSGQRTCCLPQCKRATSATQGQGGTTYRTPVSAHCDRNDFKVFPKPRQRSSLRPHQGPPSTRQTSPPLEIVLANPPQHNNRSFENAPPR